MKKRIYAAAVLLLAGAIILGGFYIYNKTIDNAYNSAIALIHSGSYEDALAKLEKANINVLNRKYFFSDVKNQELEEAYKNTVPLYAYALAQAEYNSEDRYMKTVNDYLNCIPEDYSGELCGEIKAFKENFKPQYDGFLAEEERKAEELRLQIEESKRRYYSELKNKIPYEGMSEGDINSTIMGNYDEKDYDSKYGDTKYYWKTIYGDIMLIVTCKEGKVTSVSRYGWDSFWTEDMKPVWNGINRHKNKINSSKEKKSDPYDVYDYSDPEDFYYDNYDDFWDYEDAEDYFNEHHED